MTNEEHNLIDAVRDHAHLHYNEDGWDIVAECMDDDDILDVIIGCKTEAGAIQLMKAEIAPHYEYRKDIEGTVF